VKPPEPFRIAKPTKLPGIKPYKAPVTHVGLVGKLVAKEITKPAVPKIITKLPPMRIRPVAFPKPAVKEVLIEEEEYITPAAVRAVGLKVPTRVRVPTLVKAVKPIVKPKRLPIQIPAYKPIQIPVMKPVYKPITRVKPRLRLPVPAITRAPTMPAPPIIPPRITPFVVPPLVWRKVKPIKFKRRKVRRFKQPRRYTPSLTAVVFKIRGKMPKRKLFTGIEIRPLVPRKKKKKFPKMSFKRRGFRL